MSTRELLSNIEELALFNVSDAMYGIDIVHVREIIKNLLLSKVYKADDFVCGLQNLRGEIITVIDLRVKLNYPVSPINARQRVIVVRYRDENVGLLVDEVEDIIPIDQQYVDSIRGRIEGVNPDYLAGVYKRQTDLVNIINVDSLLCEEEGFSHSQPGSINKTNSQVGRASVSTSENKLSNYLETVSADHHHQSDAPAAINTLLFENNGGAFGTVRRDDGSVEGENIADQRLPGDPVLSARQQNTDFTDQREEVDFPHNHYIVTSAAADQIGRSEVRDTTEEAQRDLLSIGPVNLKAVRALKRTEHRPGNRVSADQNFESRNFKSRNFESRNFESRNFESKEIERDKSSLTSTYGRANDPKYGSERMRSGNKGIYAVAILMAGLLILILASLYFNDDFKQGLDQVSYAPNRANADEETEPVLDFPEVVDELTPGYNSHINQVIAEDKSTIVANEKLKNIVHDNSRDEIADPAVGDSILMNISADTGEITIQKISEPGIYETYRVKKGDTLWHIAARFTGNPLNYPVIAKTSNVQDPDFIIPNQKIYVNIDHAGKASK